MLHPRIQIALDFMNEILAEDGITERAAERHHAHGDWTGDRNAIGIAHPVTFKQYVVLLNDQDEAWSMMPKSTYIDMYR